MAGHADGLRDSRAPREAPNPCRQAKEQKQKMHTKYKYIFEQNGIKQHVPGTNFVIFSVFSRGKNEFKNPKKIKIDSYGSVLVHSVLVSADIRLQKG